MEKRGFLLILLLAPLCAAVDYTVTREFMASPVSPGQELIVRLHVDIGPDTDAYAIDETFPAGWTLINAGGGNTTQANHLKWLVIGENGQGYDCTVEGCVQTITEIIYSYAVRAPSTAQTATFSGAFIFDTQTAESQILGNRTIQVIAPATACNGLSTQAACVAQTGCGWCSVGTPSCVNASALQCASAGCFNSTHLCTTGCLLSQCQSGQVCSNSACATPASNTTNTTNPAQNNTNPAQNTTTNSTPICTPSWSCTWGTCTQVGSVGQQTGTCVDSLCGTAQKTETRACRLTKTTDTGSSGSGTTTGTTTTGGRTRTPSNSTTGTSGRTPSTLEETSTNVRQRTDSGSSGRTPGGSTDEGEDLTDETTIETTKKTFDSLFYILAAVLALGIIGIVFYYLRNKPTLVKQPPPPTTPPRAF